jgi:hypothetical protein
MYHRDRIESLYNLVTGDEDARVCKDIPPAACNDQPHNFFAYLGANFLGKVADEIASARLILPWLFGLLAAPAALVAFLVPIREAGVLLPQLAVAATIRHIAIRKWIWIGGAALSALSLAVMGVIGLTLSGAVAGWALIVALIIFSLARGVCSVTAKDVLGKTVSKSRRGRMMGISAALAGIATLAIGIAVEAAGQGAGVTLLSSLLIMGALIWLPAIIAFALLREQPGATEGGGNALSVALQHLALLKHHPAFRRFVITRLLLLSVALAPPFYVLLIQQQSSGLAGLGLLIIAVGIADSLSAPIWGRMADSSSRKVMAWGALLAGLLGILVSALYATGVAWLNQSWLMGLAYLLLIVAHSGVRLGRKVYLVDMAVAGDRAAMVAVSNTVIGLAMLLAGGIGIIALWAGSAGVIFALALISLIAAVWAWRLPEVSE